MLTKLSTWMVKSAPPSRSARRGTAYPPCTPAAHCARAGRGVTAFWLKYQDPARCLRRVTQPPHIAGQLCLSLIDATRNPSFMVQNQDITLKFEVTVTINNDT
jgi:hypothetical protein